MLLSIICHIIRDSKDPENYKHGFVFTSINHTLPSLSIKKSYPNISNPNIFFYPRNFYYTDLILCLAKDFISFITY